MSDETSRTLEEIKRLCILNFLEVQDLKRRLKIAEASPQDLYDYANAVQNWVHILDGKMRNLIKDFPHLLKE